MRIDGPVQHQPLADRQIGVRVNRLFLADVAGAESGLVLVVGKDVSVSEAVDGRVQDGAAMFVTIGRQICAPASQTQPQRRPRANVEDFVAHCLRLAPLLSTGPYKQSQRSQQRPAVAPEAAAVRPSRSPFADFGGELSPTSERMGWVREDREATRSRPQALSAGRGLS